MKIWWLPTHLNAILEVLVVHETFLELYSKTVLQQSLKYLK